MTLFQLSGAQHRAPAAKWNADFSSFCYGSARATPAWGAVMPQPIPANLCCSSRPGSIRWEQPCSPHEAPAPSRSGIRLSSFLRLGSTRHPGGRSCDVCHEGRGRKGSVQVQLHRGASNGRQVDALCQARRCQDPCPLTPRTHQLAIGLPQQAQRRITQMFNMDILPCQHCQCGISASRCPIYFPMELFSNRQYN